MVDNFEYKSLSNEELNYVFQGADFLLKPMRHQYISLAFAATRERVAFLHGVGTGKTLCALYSLKLWDCKKTLVICPSSAFGSWRRDLENHTNFSFGFLTGSGRDRRRVLKKDKDIFVINYEGLKVLYSKLLKGEGWQIQDDSFIHDFDCIILDEVHKVKNYESLQSRICYELSKRAKHLVGLTGTPIDRTYLELFNIFRVIDLGKSLGTNFFAYRFRHFDKRIAGNRWRHWTEWDLKRDHEQEILDRISDTTLSFSREECFELPPLQEIVKYIHPSKRFLELQKDIISNKVLKSKDKEVLIENCIKAKAHVLRELPSGFFYYGKDREVYRMKKSPKVETLLDLLEDTHSKVIVFYWYIEERKIISEALKKAGITFCSSHFDRENQIRKFSEDEDVKVLLSQSTAGGEGFDAYAANVVVYFSPLSSPKMRKQCTGRAYRKGQTKKVLVVDFVVEHSIEERVVDNRGERFNLVKEAMVHIRDFHKSLEDEGV